MTYLVTGSTGFIGSQICRALVADGRPVRAFHRSSSPLIGLEGLVVEHAIGDITQPETLAAAMQGVDYVFHTAAQLGQVDDPEQMYAVTVAGTRNVLQAAAMANVQRVVHTSSVAALGVPSWAESHPPTETGKPSVLPLINERHTWNYRPEWWRYGHAKYLAELEVQRAVAEGLDVVIVNPAVVIGAGDLHRVSGNIILHVARRHVPVTVPGGLNVVHIDDVVRGHLAALTRGRTGERYILGGENLSHTSFLKMIAEVTGVAPPRLTLPANLVRSLAGPLALIERWLPLPVNGETLRQAGYFFYYDTAKATHALSLPAPLPARQAIAEAYAWYQKHLTEVLG